MIVMRLTAALLFLGAIAGQAGAAEVKLLSVEAMKPALQELAPAFETASKHKLKIEYGTPEDHVAAHGLDAAGIRASLDGFLVRAA